MIPLKRWMKYVKPYWPYFVLGPLCMIVEVIGEVLMPKLYSQIIKNADPQAGDMRFVIGLAALMILVAAS